MGWILWSGKAGESCSYPTEASVQPQRVGARPLRNIQDRQSAIAPNGGPAISQGAVQPGKGCQPANGQPGWGAGAEHGAGRERGGHAPKYPLTPKSRKSPSRYFPNGICRHGPGDPSSQVRTCALCRSQAGTTSSAARVATKGQVPGPPQGSTKGSRTPKEQGTWSWGGALGCPDTGHPWGRLDTGFDYFHCSGSSWPQRRIQW